jgi:hypothetical protein
LENKDKQVRWKKKALDRSKENRLLKKRLREVTVSREKWRLKYRDLHSRQRALECDKPSRHHYPGALIWLCIQVYNCCHCSYRNCCQMVVASCLVFKVHCGKPSAATIRNWMIKYGYYHYKYTHKPAGQYALIVDESVSIGQEKLLVVLGVPLDNWTFTHTLSHKDVHVLHISMATSWKADAIAAILKDLSTRYQISYCLSDKGNNIMGALRLAECYHVYDCSHQWARLMENLYGKSEDFLVLMSSVSMLRKRWILSKYSYLMPPSVRNKSRFQNIFPIISWVEKVWLHWELLDQAAKEQLGFLEQSRALLGELMLLQQVIAQMSTVLKIQGLSKSTKTQCEDIIRVCEHGRPREFKVSLLQEWQVYEQRLNDQTLLCSSDIIESYFGRFKYKIKSNGMQAITESVLTMAGWTTPVTKENVNNALTKIYIKDIEQWKKENTTLTLIKKRKQFFSKTDRKHT